MMTLESAFSDTSYDMELEKIKKKIMRLYTDLVEKTFRMSNPGASPEDIEAFLESNAIEFKGEGFDEEAEGLEQILDLLYQDEDLDPVREKKSVTPKVQTGDLPKSHRENRLWRPSTKSLEDPAGGLFTPPDKHKRPKTKALEAPRGKISRLIDDDPKVSTRGLKDIWDEERQRLLELVRKRNKEHGVKFW